MNELQIFAFFALPILVLAVGAAAAWLHTWDLKRRHRLHPGE